MRYQGTIGIKPGGMHVCQEAGQHRNCQHTAGEQAGQGQDYGGRAWHLQRSPDDWVGVGSSGLKPWHDWRLWNITEVSASETSRYFVRVRHTTVSASESGAGQSVLQKRLAARISAPRRAMVTLEPRPTRWATAGRMIRDASAKPAPRSREAISGCCWFTLFCSITVSSEVRLTNC